ncbi:hypothetical protein STENM36S_02114 [Streptomyces tendae]
MRPTLRRPRSPPRRTAGPGPCAATTRPTPTVRSIQEPAGTLFFGHRANECTWVAEPATPSATDTDAPAVPEPIRITAREAGLLQTFPADYPWAGNKGQQFSQIGNAVPPLLAGHLLAPHLGVTLDPDDFTLAA